MGIILKKWRTESPTESKRVTKTKPTSTLRRNSPDQKEHQTKQVCIKFREGQVVCKDPHCRKLHVIPRKDCTNASYVKFGICSNWSKCRARHPWDQDAWGDKDEAYARYQKAQKEAKLFVESKMISFAK